MPNVNLYVPDAEMALWDAARRVAKQQNTSLYRVVVEALETELPRIAAKPAPETRWARIAADVA